MRWVRWITNTLFLFARPVRFGKADHPWLGRRRYFESEESTRPVGGVHLTSTVAGSSAKGLAWPNKNKLGARISTLVQKRFPVVIHNADGRRKAYFHRVSLREGHFVHGDAWAPKRVIRR